MVTYAGAYDAYGFVLPGDRDKIADLVRPLGLTLKTQSITASDKHPVMFLAGRQTHVRPAECPDWICGSRIGRSICLNYLELIAAIPFVEYQGKTISYVCSTCLVLDDVTPILLGWLGGFPKEIGKISWKGDDYRVKKFRGAPIYNSTLRSNGTCKPPNQWPHFAELRPIFEQRHIGRLDCLQQLVCTEMDFRLNTEATIEPCSGSATITRHLCPPLDGTHRIPSLKDAPLGGFRLRTKWTLTGPVDCS